MLVQQIETWDFTCEERESDSPYIESVWYKDARDEDATPFISIAQPLWNMVISKIDGQTSFTIRGPETSATSAISPPNAEFIGIMFKVGTLMPLFPASSLMDRADAQLPAGCNNTFWLNSSTWQYPDYDNVETFVDWLVREEIIQFDPVVADAMQYNPVDLSLRSTQRRFKKATGLTQGLMEQINRARYATKLLKSGISYLDTAYEAGYADQPHLIRSLNRFIGLTPQQIISEDRDERLSFLFNTLFD